MPICFSCRKELDLPHPVGLREACPSCGADVHSCRNCEFYDPKVSNECREPQAERVLDKERANFCDYFCLAVPLHSFEEKGDAAAAKRRLEELFKKR